MIIKIIMVATKIFIYVVILKFYLLEQYKPMFAVGGHFMWIEIKSRREV